MANKPLDPGTELADYTLIRRISNGGMGMVYLARNNDGKPVVIKEYLPQHLNLRKQGVRVHVFNPRENSIFEAGMKEFFGENEVLSKIQHKSVVQVVDCFQMNNTAYSVMEYVYGQSLQHVIQAEGEYGLPESFIRKVFLDVLSGVTWLHNNRILHLDIKPSNIYVTHSGKAMLLDFGTAWLLDFDSPEKKKKPPMHTPGFAPPEQHKMYYLPTRIGTQTDLYALGCSMYSCISGNPPEVSTERMNGDESLAEIDYMGRYSPWLLKTIDRLMTLGWDKRPNNSKNIWLTLEESKAVNYEDPIRSHFENLISRTQLNN